jgi:hypothetical protein
MSSVLRTFVNRLCEVIYERRSLSSKLKIEFLALKEILVFLGIQSEEQKYVPSSSREE